MPLPSDDDRIARYLANFQERSIRDCQGDSVILIRYVHPPLCSKIVLAGAFYLVVLIYVTDQTIGIDALGVI